MLKVLKEVEGPGKSCKRLPEVVILRVKHPNFGNAQYHNRKCVLLQFCATVTLCVGLDEDSFA